MINYGLHVANLRHTHTTYDEETMHTLPISDAQESFARIFEEVQEFINVTENPYERTLMMFANMKWLNKKTGWNYVHIHSTYL